MRLSQLCTVRSGYTARNRLDPLSSGGVPAIQLRDLAAGGQISPDILVRLDLGELDDRYFVGAGDVVFRSRGDRNTATALDDRFIEPAVALLPLIVLRPKPDFVTPEYLAWAINQPAAQRQLDSTARGTSMRMVPKSSLDELEIDVPDLKTQRRIVAIDALAEREHALMHLLAGKRRKLTALILGEQAKLIHRGPGPKRKKK